MIVVGVTTPLRVSGGEGTLVFGFVIFEGVVPLKTGVWAQGCVTQLAPIPRLMTLARYNSKDWWFYVDVVTLL